jgi:hypothetical protein
MFTRFVVGADAENAARLTGVITEAAILDDTGELYAYESEVLRETFDWFNANLPCPPFQAKQQAGEWTRDAVCWFRAETQEPLRRIWDIVAILREYGKPVRLVTSEKPGKIVYADRFQVVAETPRWA